MSTEPTARLDAGRPDDETTVRVTPPAVPAEPFPGAPAAPAAPDDATPWQLRAAVGAWWVALGLGLLTTPLVLGSGSLWAHLYGGSPIPGDPLVIIAGVLAGLFAVAHWGVQVATTVALRRGSGAARLGLGLLAVLSAATDIAAIVLVGPVLIVGLCAWHLALVVAGVVLMATRPVGAHVTASREAVVEDAPVDGGAPVAGLAPDVVPAPDRPRRRAGAPVVVGAAALGLLLVVLQLTAFAGGSYRRQLAEVIATGLSRNVQVSAVECSWTSGAAAFLGGAVGHTCDAVLDGIPTTVEVTSQNAENFDATTLEVENLPVLEQQLARSLQRQGQAVTSVDCGDGTGRRLVPAPRGTRIPCRLSGPAGQGTLVATITDAYGHASVSDR